MLSCIPWACNWMSIRNHCFPLWSVIHATADTHATQKGERFHVSATTFRLFHLLPSRNGFSLSAITRYFNFPIFSFFLTIKNKYKWLEKNSSEPDQNAKEWKNKTWHHKYPNFLTNFNPHNMQHATYAILIEKIILFACFGFIHACKGKNVELRFNLYHPHRNAIAINSVKEV